MSGNYVNYATANNADALDTVLERLRLNTLGNQMVDDAALLITGLSVGTVVKYDSTDNRWEACDGTAALTATDVIGIVTYVASPDTSGQVKVGGVYVDDSLTEDTRYYCQSDGSLGSTPTEVEIGHCCAAGQLVLKINGSGGGSGDVTGPASSTDGDPVYFDGTDGKTIKSGRPALSLVCALPAVFERDQFFEIAGKSTAADRYKILTPNRIGLNINGSGWQLTTQKTLDLSDSAYWDSITTDYRVAATRAGVDFYIYACEPGSGYEVDILCSANSTTPTGYTASNSRKIGGFHCECEDVGTIAGHNYTGFLAGDVLYHSIWDLNRCPKYADPAGMFCCPPLGYRWFDIYLASGTGASTESAYGGTISDTRTWLDFVDDFAAVGKRLPNDMEFQVFAGGSNEETNIAGSADPGTTGGHSDTASRRMISDYGAEDCAGAMYQWLSDQSYRYDSSASFSWKDLPGSKGSLYRQGTYGDVKLLAGGYWSHDANCGSRCRNAHYYRWHTDTFIGARGAAEPK